MCKALFLMLEVLAVHIFHYYYYYYYYHYTHYFENLGNKVRVRTHPHCMGKKITDLYLNGQIDR